MSALETKITYRYYRVDGSRRAGRWTIDEVNDVGEFIAHAAYYFRTRQQAEARLQEIVAEDNAKAKPIELGRQTARPFMHMLHSRRFEGEGRP